MNSLMLKRKLKQSFHFYYASVNREFREMTIDLSVLYVYYFAW